MLVSSGFVLLFTPFIGFAVQIKRYHKICPSPCSVFAENPELSNEKATKRLIWGIVGSVVGFIIMAIVSVKIVDFIDFNSNDKRWFIPMLMLGYLVCLWVSSYRDGIKHCEQEFDEKCFTLKNHCFYGSAGLMFQKKCKILEKRKS